MGKKNWKKKPKEQQTDRLRKIFCAVAMLLGVYYLQTGLSLLNQQHDNLQSPRAEIEINIGQAEPIKPSLEDWCRDNPACENTEKADAFLYAESAKVNVIKPEEAKPELLYAKTDEATSAAIGAAARIKELIKEKVSFTVAPQENVLFANIETVSQETLDKIYEEELPDNVIDDTAGKEYTHINHTKVKDLKIMPPKKPMYFGPEPVIAIVIDDMGVSPRRTRDITLLKAPLTSSFLTYSQNLERQIEASRLAGHEIMIHVPMEPQQNIDVAPDVLTTQMSEEELQHNFAVMLDKFHNIMGVNNHMGSKLTEDEPRMEVIMKELKKRGLFFLDSKTSAKSQAEVAAKNQQVAYGHRHVFLDNNNDKAYILAQLALTEKLATKNGYAVAIGHPKTQTYAALKEWLDTLPNKKIKLVHLSEIMEVLNPQLMATLNH